MEFLYCHRKMSNQSCSLKPSSFCYICGTYVLAKKGRTISDVLKFAYLQYFGFAVRDLDKPWTPKVICTSCSAPLYRWSRGDQCYLPFTVPMIWRKPESHETDCYFCLTKVNGMCVRNRQSIVYADVTSVTQPVRRNVNDPLPVYIKSTDMDECEEHGMRSTGPRKRCRLCFEDKSRPIGIFSVKGVQMKIAELIQKHFPDGISEDDVFPNYVCIDCWTKLNDFHTFYIGVDEAKSIFLKNMTREELTSFTESDCDVFAFDIEYLPVKDELADDFAMENTDAPDELSDSLDFDGVADNNTLNTSDGDDSGDRTKTTPPVATDTDCHAENATRRAKGMDQSQEKDTNEVLSKPMNMLCSLCEAPLVNVMEAREHFRYAHAQRPAVVKCCDRKIRFKSIRDHLRYHKNPDVFKCKLCQKRFVASGNLKSHMQKHSPKVFECDICKRGFTTWDFIEAHMLGVHSSRRVQNDCHICPKRFATKAGLMQHVRNVHERVGQVVCHICAKVYSSKVSLRTHLLEHNDAPQPRVTCEICGNTFKSEQNRLKHVKRHQETGVACPRCGKMSPNRNALKTHIAYVHSAKKTLQCHFCDKKFKRRIALTEHVATHTGEDLYSCKYCPQRFKYHSSLYLHYRGVHPVEWQVDRKTKKTEPVSHP